MKIHQVTREHPMSAIATEAQTPIAAMPSLRAKVLHSDKMTGLMLANECMALVQSQAKPWHAIACRIIDTNTEVRASFLESLAKELKRVRAENIEASGVDGKTVTKLMRSAIQMVTNMQAIGRAWNAGATIRGFVMWVNEQGGKNLTLDTWREAGVTLMYTYARTVITAKGAGRPRDNLLVKFGKWLDSQRKEYEEDEAAVLASLSALYTKECKDHPELVKADK